MDMEDIEWKEPKINAGIDIMLDETLPPRSMQPVFTTLEEIQLDAPAYLKVSKDIYEELQKLPAKDEKEEEIIE